MTGVFIVLTSMAAVQADDVRAYYLLRVDLYSQHFEWLAIQTTTNCHGVAAFDFASVRLR